MHVLADGGMGRPSRTEERAAYIGGEERSASWDPRRTPAAAGAGDKLAVSYGLFFVSTSRVCTYVATASWSDTPRVFSRGWRCLVGRLAKPRRGGTRFAVPEVHVLRYPKYVLVYLLN